MADVGRKHWSSSVLAIVGLAAILLSPLILLGLAIAEQSLLGTSYLTALYDLLGIRDALQALYEWMFPYS
jgi:predicted membrane protein